MNAEHILDAIGLLDDDLIQEAEQYSRKTSRPNYWQQWMAWAASFVVVAALGYCFTRFGMVGGGGGNGGGGNASGAAGGGTNGAPQVSESVGSSVNGGADSSPDESFGEVNSSEMFPAEAPESSSGTSNDIPGDWPAAIRVAGTVYWATQEYIHLEPEEADIRYTSSFINSAEPEEDGQANFTLVGTPYVKLENGTVAVCHDESTGSWRVYAPVPPWEQ